MINLTPTQARIIKVMCQLGSNKAIAAVIGTTEATIKVHIRAILRKTGLPNRTLLAVWAMQNGYAPVDDKKTYALKMCRMMIADEPIYYGVCEPTTGTTLKQVIEMALA